jgi:hypothetical protein
MRKTLLRFAALALPLWLQAQSEYSEGAPERGQFVPKPVAPPAQPYAVPDVPDSVGKYSH